MGQTLDGALLVNYHASPLNFSVQEMAIIGWIRLLRDCRILDHRVTLVVADVLFTQVEGGADASSIQGVREQPCTGQRLCGKIKLRAPRSRPFIHSLTLENTPAS